MKKIERKGREKISLFLLILSIECGLYRMLNYMLR